MIAFADAAAAAGEEAYRRLLPDAPEQGLALESEGVPEETESTGEMVGVPAKRARLSSSPDVGAKEAAKMSEDASSSSPSSSSPGTSHLHLHPLLDIHLHLLLLLLLHLYDCLP